MIRLTSILEDILKTETAYIIENGKRAFVGVEHGVTPQIGEKDLAIIKKIGDKYGYWYEGGGGDREVVKPLFGNIQYKGSWDEKIAQIPIKNPYVYIFTLFSNTEENDTIKKVASAEGDTVFEKVLNSYKKWGHEVVQPKSKDEVRELMEQFFKKLGTDYYNDSKAEGTEENITEFIQSVEADMWDGWPNGSGPAFEMANEANSERDINLVNTIKEGVIFIGVGHIEILQKILK